jgi:hypothetical protein
MLVRQRHEAPLFSLCERSNTKGDLFALVAMKSARTADFAGSSQGPAAPPVLRPKHLASINTNSPAIWQIFR